MDVHAVCLQELDGDIFIGTRSGNTQHSVPTAFQGQTSPRRLPGDTAVEYRKIVANSGHQLVLKGMTLFEKDWHRQLYRRVHGEIRIGDDFEPRECSAFPWWRPADDQPGRLHLR